MPTHDTCSFVTFTCSLFLDIYRIIYIVYRIVIYRIIIQYSTVLVQYSTDSLSDVKNVTQGSYNIGGGPGSGHVLGYIAYVAQLNHGWIEIFTISYSVTHKLVFFQPGRNKKLEVGKSWRRRRKCPSVDSRSCKGRG